LLFLTATAPGTIAGAAEIKILSSGALKLAMTQLLPDFQKSSGNAVTIEYHVAAVIADRIQKGESADVAIVSRSQLQTLETQGKILQGSRVNIASVGIGVAVRKGAPKPDISSVAAFKRALLSARSIGYNDPASGSASGIYIASLLDRLDIAQDLNAKIKLVRPAGDELEKNFEGLAMARQMEKLTSEQVRRKKTGWVHDGGGLYLRVDKDGGRYWYFRWGKGGVKYLALGPTQAAKGSGQISGGVQFDHKLFGDTV
jgi:ABC-type molybdate transport system substrate-binding protein